MNITAKQVKDYLKENGFETQSIRVRVEHIGNGSLSIYIRVLDLSIEHNEIREICSEKFESIRRDDHVQGEILLGGNIFVMCEYDYDYLHDEIEKTLPEAKELFKKMSLTHGNEGTVVFENVDLKAVAFFQDKVIYIYDKNKDKKRINYIYPRQVMKEPYGLASTLVFLRNGRTFGLKKEKSK